MRSPLLSQEYFSVRRREDVREAVAGTRKPGNHFVVEHETGACSESFSHTILNHTIIVARLLPEPVFLDCARVKFQEEVA